MGNKFVKFDIISNLPYELVLAILCYLPTKDVTNCTLVCQNWFNIVAHLGVLWKSRAECLGLTSNVVLQCIPSFRSPRDFYIAAVKYKKFLKSNKLISSSVEHAIPSEDLFTLCLFADNNTLVRIQKTTDPMGQNSFNQLIVERISSVGPQNTITADKTNEILLPKDIKVVSTHVKGDNLYWVSRCGTWSGYNLKTNQEVCTWNHPLLKEGHGITVTSCNNCSMFVASYWVPTYSDSKQDSCNTSSAYSLQIVKLGGPEGDHPRVILNWKLFKQNHNHGTFIQHDSRYWLRKTHILSCSSEYTREHGVCDTHRLILQCDCCVVVQTIKLQSQPDKDELQVLTSNPVCINCKFQMEYSEVKSSVNHISSEVTLSSDQLLMGQVFDKKLYVWRLNFSVQCQTKNYQQERDHIKQSSLSLLPGDAMSAMCKRVKLAALGHVLSIVAYLDNTHIMEYKVQIVLTKTGEVLSEFRRIEKFYNWTICCQIDPLHRFYFMCDSNSDWLNLVQCNDITPDVPVVTVHNHGGRMHLEALQCNRITAQTWRKYWRCAINLSFRHE